MPKPRPAKFDPTLTASTPAARELVSEVTTVLDRAEAHLGLRKRRRRVTAEQDRQRQIDALVSNAVYHSITGHESMRLSLDNNVLGRDSRYRPHGITKALPELVTNLTKHTGLMSISKGTLTPFGATQSELTPTAWLKTRADERALTLYDFDRLPPPEIVLLKGAKVDNRADLVEYDESELTAQLRAQVREVNDYLKQADICFHADCASTGYLVDDRNRYMRRVFTRGDWFSGGRLFGGFWQTLGKAERLAEVSLNGEYVVSLDFAAMVVNLLYARVGMAAPPGDAYTLPAFSVGDGTVVTVPRGVVKKILSACLFVDSPLRAWPRDLQGWQTKLPISRVIAAIVAAHPAVAPLFFTGVGHALQHSESEILMDVMLQMVRADIPALPVHDCLVVPQSAAQFASAAMSNTFSAHQRGYTCPVKVETAADLV